MSKKITTSLNGKELTLYVSVPRFYNLFKEVIGKDLLVMAEQMKESENHQMVDLIEVAKGIVCAGYFTECQKNKVTPELTKEEIFEAIDFSEENYHIKIINEWSSISTSSSNGVAPKEGMSQLSQ
jgi:hypothetical protein